MFGVYKYPPCILYVSHAAQRERNVEQKRSVSAIVQAAESERERELVLLGRSLPVTAEQME